MHTRVLAEADVRLPPIIVHRDTMQVIDGVHRVQAARLRGERTIEALLIDGDAETAFVRAVEANISHGLPLSMADRRAAAERIIELYPDWSDRAVAASTGLGAGTVRAIRGRLADGFEQSGRRVGRDGRVRPLNAAEGRRRAAELIAERPDASLRAIASAAGVSVGTARDVRIRLQEGRNPVPSGLHIPRPSGEPDDRECAGSDEGGQRPPSRLPLRAPSSILEGLRNDPALRYSERGRSIVRWLAAHLVDAEDSSRIAEYVPPHAIYPIMELAFGYAEAWQRLAEDLADRARAAGAARPADR
jgi:hypothetical protein